MSKDGMYLHLTADRGAIDRAEERRRDLEGWTYEEARESAIIENRAQQERNAIARELRRVARAAEEYATSLEKGRHLAVARAALEIAIGDLRDELADQKVRRV